MSGLITLALYQYMLDEYPDVLIKLQEEGKVNGFIREQVTLLTGMLDQSLAEGASSLFMTMQCKEHMLSTLGPSRYRYIESVLIEAYEPVYCELFLAGILQFEIMALLTECAAAFEAFPLQAQKAPHIRLHFLVTGIVQAYIEQKFQPAAGLN